MADQGKLCKIANNSGKDVQVALSINTDQTTSQNAISSVNKQFEILTLSEGGTVIKNGSTGTVTLDRNYKPDADAKGYVSDYDLIICDNNWLYPLAIIPSVQQMNNGSSGFEPVKVDAGSLTAMSQTISFYQTIAAYPNSQLAKDYRAMLKQVRKDALDKADGSPDSANVVSAAITDAMNSFFKSTTEYQLVTQAGIVAIDNYYNSFPAIWAQYENDMTYYLYGSDGTVNTFAGTLTLKKSGTIDITKANGGYTCLFVPAVDPSNNDQTNVDTSKAVNLTYVNGAFLSDPNADKPAIGLRGSFLLKRLFTNDPNDNSVISIVTGTVNNIQCIGLDASQSGSKPVQQNLTATAESTSDTIVAYWESLTHPKSRQDWIVSIFTLIGAVLLIPAIGGAVYGIYRLVKYKTKTKEQIAREALEKRLARLDVNEETGRIKWNRSASEVNTQNALDVIEAATELAEAGVIQQTLTMAIVFQKYSVQEVLKYSTTLDPADKISLQEALTSVRQSEKNINKIFDDYKVTDGPQAFTQRMGQLKQEVTNFTETQDTFEGIYKKVASTLQVEAKEFVDTNMSNTSTIFEQMKETEVRENTEESEVDIKVEEEIKPFEFVK